jgi:hypothetical protein
VERPDPLERTEWVEVTDTQRAKFQAPTDGLQYIETIQGRQRPGLHDGQVPFNDA